MSRATNVVPGYGVGQSGDFAIRRLQRKASGTLCPANSQRSDRHGQRCEDTDAPAIEETVRRAQQGDAAAFEAIYHQHSRRVYSLCLRMAGDPTEAEDLAQEAFLQLFRKIHTFRGESAFSSWLHRLTANVVLMRFRKKRPTLTSLDEMSRDDNENNRPAIEIGTQDLSIAGVPDRLNLQDAVRQLPGGYKLMFTLHDVQGYEHNEIAAMLGCSVGNSKSQLHKARKRLRELLNKAQRQRRYGRPTVLAVATT